jgi:hypothetical protein
MFLERSHDCSRWYLHSGEDDVITCTAQIFCEYWSDFQKPGTRIKNKIFQMRYNCSIHMQIRARYYILWENATGYSNGDGVDK